MKLFILIIISAFILVGLFSCKKGSNTIPVIPNRTKLDTSTTLIGNTGLVGVWNLVTDTISFQIDTMYHGTTTDHYTFTKYGNLYVRNGFNEFIDTAIYSFYNTNHLNWKNLYAGQNGLYSYGVTYFGGFAVKSVDNHSLVITDSLFTSLGYRYEQIVLKK